MCIGHWQIMKPQLNRNPTVQGSDPEFVGTGNNDVENSSSSSLPIRQAHYQMLANKKD